jgi:hypothetical protein
VLCSRDDTLALNAVNVRNAKFCDRPAGSHQSCGR